MKEFIKKNLVYLILTAVLLIPIIILFLNEAIAWISFWVLCLGIVPFFIYFCIAIVLNVVGFIGVMKNKAYGYVSFLPLVYGGFIAVCTVNKDHEDKKNIGIFALVYTFLFVIYPLTVYCLYEFGYYHMPSV
ncbi:MAG: hypothetical protein IJ035_10950 [Oscillospiraceae bacterium]|nr:hypothetical protein [Oscillospiraceae bacterium]